MGYWSPPTATSSRLTPLENTGATGSSKTSDSSRQKLKAEMVQKNPETERDGKPGKNRTKKRGENTKKNEKTRKTRKKNETYEGDKTQEWGDHKTSKGRRL